MNPIAPGSTKLTTSSSVEFFYPDIEWFRPELRDLFDLSDPALEYIIDAIRAMKHVGCDVQDPEVLKQAINAGRAKAAQFTEDDTGLMAYERQQRRTLLDEAHERELRRQELMYHVYYARIGNRVKIGYTGNLAKRMSSINPEDLLATELGAARKEAERHRQFAYLRVHGEWFRYEDALVEHVAALRLHAQGPTTRQR